MLTSYNGPLLCLPSVQPTVVTKLEIIISLLSPIFDFKEGVPCFRILKYNRLFSVLTQREDLEL